MASIVLSFVGQQDPVSDNTREDGSIITLLRHLMAERQSIKQVILLYTTGTQDRAELTQGWLTDAPFRLPEDAIALLSVGDELSHDPVNLWLAVQAARQGLDAAMVYCGAQDTLEFNGSSGTPVMKSTWSILQAAGYAPKSRLWQVRNPKEQQVNQERVFQTNIQVLRQAFDLKVIKQQLQDYNYGGALTTLRATGLSTPLLEALLNYGRCRLSLDFSRAHQAIASMPQAVSSCWLSDVRALIQGEPRALLPEAYFNAIVELKNQQFSDFLVRVSQFQEQALQLFGSAQLEGQPPLPKSFDDTKRFWADFGAKQPDLHQFLETQRYKTYPLRLEGYPGRPVWMAMLTYGNSPVLSHLQTLDAYCDQRNQYIHRLGGTSELEGVNGILRAMRQVLAHLGQSDFENPFNQLNQEILQSLEMGLQTTAFLG